MGGGGKQLTPTVGKCFPMQVLHPGLRRLRRLRKLRGDRAAGGERRGRRLLHPDQVNIPTSIYFSILPLVWFRLLSFFIETETNTQFTIFVLLPLQGIDPALLDPDPQCSELQAEPKAGTLQETLRGVLEALRRTGLPVWGAGDCHFPKTEKRK